MAVVSLYPLLRQTVRPTVTHMCRAASRWTTNSSGRSATPASVAPCSTFGPHSTSRALASPVARRWVTTSSPCLVYTSSGGAGKNDRADIEFISVVVMLSHRASRALVSVVTPYVPTSSTASTAPHRRLWCACVVQECTCENDRAEVLSAICAATWCEAAPCSAAVQPAGHCCPMCGQYSSGAVRLVTKTPQ